jgi:hypothetical protein
MHKARSLLALDACGSKILATQEAAIKRLMEDWGVAQMAEHLPSKCKVLSSNPRTAKIK